jgi:WD40 repeat protein
MDEGHLTAQDPRQIGTYHLWRRLGTGAQGVVYEAYAPSRAPAAVKALHPGKAPSHPPGREVEAASRIGGSWVAKVLAYDLVGPPAYIAGELIRGPNLSEAIDRDGVLDDAVLEGLALAVATALVAIHEAGVVHRDLKPANVIIGPDGPRVVDFGLARLIDHQQTQSGGQPGTLPYLAPELLSPENGKAGPAADVFAWGALLVFAATGRHVFDRDTSTAVINALRSQQPDLSALPARIRPWVEAALSKSPQDRPIAARIVDALQATTDGVPAWPHSDPGAWPTPEQAAELSYGELTREQQDALPAILLRMLTPTWVARPAGGDIEYRTVLVGRQDFDDTVDLGPAQLADLLQRLVNAGILVGEASTPSSSVRINSAILIMWGRLRTWLADEGLDLFEFDTIRQAARSWQDGKTPRALFDREELETANRWATARHHPALNKSELDFLDASGRARTRAARRNGLIASVLAVLLVFALAAAGWAVRQQRKANQERDAAISGQLATRSELLGNDPVLSALLAAAAWRISPTSEARSSLATVISRPSRGILTGDTTATHGAKNVVFSPDGNTLAVAGNDGTVRLWDMSTHQQLGAPLANSGLVFSMAFSPDGKILATGSQEGTVWLWDLRARRHLGSSLTHSGPVETITFSADGQTLIASSANELRLWNVTTRRLTEPPSKYSGSFSSVAFGPDRKTMVTNDGRRLRLWNVNDHAHPGLQMTTGTDAATHTLAISPDGKVLATSSGGGGEEGASSTVRLWDLRTHHQLGMVTDQSGFVGALAFSPDGSTLALTERGLAQLWDVRTRHKISSPFVMPGQAFSLAFSPDGRTLASGSDNGAVWLWDVRAHRQLGSPIAHNGWVQAVAFSPEGKTLAIGGGGDGKLAVWDAGTRRRIDELTGLDGGIVMAVAFSPDGRTLATDLGNGPQLWDFRTRKSLGVLANLPSATTALAFSPNGTMLAIGNSEGTQLWNLRTRKSIWKADKATYGITSLAFSPDGKTIATSSGGNGEQGTDTFDKTVRLLDSHTGHQIGVLTGHTSFVTTEAFSPDGRTLATGSVDGTVRLWDVNAHRQIGSPLDQDGSVTSVAFSPDGFTFAVASNNTVNRDWSIRLWDGDTRQQLGSPLTGHSGPIDALAFSPNGQTLATGSEDETARLWGVATQRDPIDDVCKIAGRSLDHQEWTRYVPVKAFQQVCP